MSETAQAAQPPRLRPRRNLRLVAIGVLAVALGGLGAAVLYSSVADSHSVVTIKRTVYRDQPITADDLGLVSLSTGPGLETVPAEQLSEVVGQTALVDLVEGSLLSPRGFGAAAVEPGSVRLGLRLAPGRLPVSELPPGTAVLLVAVAPDGSTPANAASYQGRIASAAVQLADGATVVDVAVVESTAEQVARLAASDQLVVVRQAEAER